MKKVKTFEAACKIEGLDPKIVIPDFSNFPEKDKVAMVSHAKLIIIAKAINRVNNDDKEWIPDWNNWDEYKYYPWFEMGSPGFRSVDYGVWITYSALGSRLCFLSSEISDFMGDQFLQLYKDYYTI